MTGREQKGRCREWMSAGILIQSENETVILNFNEESNKYCFPLDEFPVFGSLEFRKLSSVTLLTMPPSYLMLWKRLDKKTTQGKRLWLHQQRIEVLLVEWEAQGCGDSRPHAHLKSSKASLTVQISLNHINLSLMFYCEWVLHGISEVFITIIKHVQVVLKRNSAFKSISRDFHRVTET